MARPESLEAGLSLLGELLAHEKTSYDLVLVGAGALFLKDIVMRPSEDLDVVAIVSGGRLRHAEPFPEDLQRCVRSVGKTLDLAQHERDGKDWLNPCPAFLLTLGLPEGFESRLTSKVYGALTIRLPDRIDLIHLKLWAATDRHRARSAVDIEDLRALAPTREEILQAAAWCAQRDGRPDFMRLDGLPVLARLGFGDGTPS